MAEYTAIVERSTAGWAIYVPAVERHTWSPTVEEIGQMACDLVHAMTDAPLHSIAVVFDLPVADPAQTGGH